MADSPSPHPQENLEQQPPQEQPAEAPQDSPVEKTAAPSNKKSILIVEDERPLSHALELKFQREGYETCTVNNGEDGLKEVQTGKHSAVLLDLIMPGMDGFTFLQKAKGDKTPIIVLTNLGQDEDRARAKEMGAADYFVKSNTPITEIVKHVKKIT
jgi:DNA-binding response OmpR family regulator